MPWSALNGSLGGSKMNKLKNQDQRILMCGACGKHKKVCCWKIDIVCKKRDEPNPNIPEDHMAYLRERKMWASDLERLHIKNPEQYPEQGQTVELYPNEPVEPRKCVRDFARVMEEKLRENDCESEGNYSEQWFCFDVFELTEKLDKKVSELKEKVKGLAKQTTDNSQTPEPLYRETVTNIQQEAANVANCAMIINERCDYLKRCFTVEINGEK
jgi:hypothetical protein